MTLVLVDIAQEQCQVQGIMGNAINGTAYLHGVTRTRTRSMSMSHTWALWGMPTPTLASWLDFYILLTYKKVKKIHSHEIWLGQVFAGHFHFHELVMSSSLCLEETLAAFWSRQLTPHPLFQHTLKSTVRALIVFVFYRTSYIRASCLVLYYFYIYLYIFSFHSQLGLNLYQYDIGLFDIRCLCIIFSSLMCSTICSPCSGLLGVSVVTWNPSSTCSGQTPLHLLLHQLHHTPLAAILLSSHSRNVFGSLVLAFSTKFYFYGQCS